MPRQCNERNKCYTGTSGDPLSRKRYPAPPSRRPRCPVSPATYADCVATLGDCVATYVDCVATRYQETTALHCHIATSPRRHIATSPHRHIATSTRGIIQPWADDCT